MRGLRLGLGLGGSIINGASLATAFAGRVAADGGTVNDRDYLANFLNHAINNGYYGNLAAAYSPSWGVKGSTTAEKLYSVIGTCDLTNATPATQPDIEPTGTNGMHTVRFTGTSDFLQCMALNVPQPSVSILAGATQVTWVDTDVIFDGGDAGGRNLLQQSTPSPNIRMFAGTFGSLNGGLAVGTAGYVESVFNGASSTLTVNNGSPVTSNVGTAGLIGFTLANRFSPGPGGADLRVGAVVILRSAVSATIRTAIYNFFKAVYATP